jgi:hypothetical protein
MTACGLPGSYSQFVDLRAGSLWRADYLKAKAPPAGQVRWHDHAHCRQRRTDAYLDAQVDALSISNARAMVMLPAGMDYIPGSATLSGASVADPQNSDGTLISVSMNWLPVRSPYLPSGQP